MPIERRACEPVSLWPISSLPEGTKVGSRTATAPSSTHNRMDSQWERRGYGHK